MRPTGGEPSAECELRQHRRAIYRSNGAGIVAQANSNYWKDR
jgi:hypothetical protein